MRYIDADKLTRDLIVNKNFYPAIVKCAIENAPTEDVVPRSEVEKADKEIERLTKILENYAFRYGTVTDKQKVIDQAKREVAREIFEEIEKLLARHSHTCLGYSEIIGNYYYEKQLGNSIAEFKKKYIGE